MRIISQQQWAGHLPWTVPDWLDAAAGPGRAVAASPPLDADAVPLTDPIVVQSVVAAETPPMASEARAAEPNDGACTAQVLAAIEARLASSSSEMLVFAEAAARRMAAILAQSLAAAFPMLEERFGPDEVRAFMQSLLPGLMTTRGILVRVAPSAVVALEQDFEALSGGARARLLLQADETLSDGDIRVAWSDGEATRDAALIRQSVLQALALIGDDLVTAAPAS